MVVQKKNVGEKTAAWSIIGYFTTARGMEITQPAILLKLFAVIIISFHMAALYLVYCYFTMLVRGK